MLDALINSENLLDDLGTGVVLHAPNADILYANNTALRLLKMTLAEMQGKELKKDWHLIDEFHQLLPVEGFPVNQVIQKQTEVKNFTLGVCSSVDSEITWLLINAYPRFNDNKELDSVAVTFVDITQRKVDIPFESIVSNANDIVLVTEANNIEGPDHPQIVYVNKAFTELTGYTADEVIGKTPRILQGEETSLEARKCIKMAIVKHEPVHCQLLNYSKSGEKYWIELNIYPLKNTRGEVTYLAAIERDITLQKTRELELQTQADQDFLTKLPNRRAFNEKAEAAMQIKHEYGFSMVMIDVDNFKSINDNYGHAFGDKVLKKLSQQLMQNFRSQDLLVRLGGEEFGVMLLNTSADIAFSLMEQFRRKVAKIKIPTEEGVAISITVSIGIYATQSSDLTLDGVLSKADEALYLAKNSGKNQTRINRV